MDELYRKKIFDKVIREICQGRYGVNLSLFKKVTDWFKVKCVLRCFLERGWSPTFFVTFKVTSFWKFHWNSSSLSEDMKIFSFNINYFHQFFWVFCHLLVTKKLMTSYVTSFYFQPNLNKLFNSCIKLYRY